MSLNLDSLLPWLMEVRFIVGLTAAFSNVNFFPPNVNFYSNTVLLPYMGKSMGLLTEKYPKSIQGKTYSTLKITPKIYLVCYAFQTSFVCITLFCSHTIHSPLKEKREVP